MENTLTNILKNFGFNEYETKVYLACLELGRSSVLEISKKAGIKRTTVYNIVGSLLEKGLLSKFEDEKGQKFLAQSPEKLLDMLQERTNDLASSMPQLLAIANTGSEIKPEVKFYQGKEGLKAVYQDTLNSCEKGDEITGYFCEEPFRVFPEYLGQRTAKGIKGRGFAMDSEITKKHKDKDKKELRETKIISKLDLPITIEKNMYKDKVAFMNFRGVPFGVIIKSPQIYKAEKAIFELLWKKMRDKV